MPIREFATITPGEANPKVIASIGLLREAARALESSVDRLAPRVDELEARPVPLTIEQIREFLEFQGGKLALNVTGLLGRLAEPQIPDITLFETVVAGGAAGDIAVPGIDVGMTLVSVIEYVGAGVAVTDVVDLTSEFTITAVGTINNDGGTNTTGSKLKVLWTRQ